MLADVHPVASSNSTTADKTAALQAGSLASSGAKDTSRGPFTALTLFREPPVDRAAALCHAIELDHAALDADARDGGPIQCDVEEQGVEVHDPYTQLQRGQLAEGSSARQAVGRGFREYRLGFIATVTIVVTKLPRLSRSIKWLSQIPVALA